LFHTFVIFNWGSTKIGYAIYQEVQILVSHWRIPELWVQSQLILCEILYLNTMFLVSWANSFSTIVLYSSVSTT
jgi:hypothetical protein